MKLKIYLILLIIVINFVYYKKNNEYNNILNSKNKYLLVNNKNSKNNERKLFYKEILNFLIDNKERIFLKKIDISRRTKIIFISDQEFGKIIEKYWNKSYNSLKIKFNNEKTEYMISF